MKEVKEGIKEEKEEKKKRGCPPNLQGKAFVVRYNFTLWRKILN